MKRATFPSHCKMKQTAFFVALCFLCLKTGMNIPNNEVKSKLSNTLIKGLMDALARTNSWSASVKGPLAISVKYDYLYPVDVNVNHRSEDMESCNKLYQAGYNESSVYVIRPKGHKSMNVYCTMKNGGWTVFQRRLNGRVDFYRTWREYKIGFGSIVGEFWLGNDALSALTQKGKCQLRIDLEDFSNVTKYAVYDQFKVDDESHGYKLTIGKYHGDAGDGLAFQNGMKFTTKDKDQDTFRTNCAISYKGAWWYASCHTSNLNGHYLGGKHKSFADGIEWYYWHGHHYSLKSTTMMLKCE